MKGKIIRWLGGLGIGVGVLWGQGSWAQKPVIDLAVPKLVTLELRTKATYTGTLIRFDVTNQRLELKQSDRTFTYGLEEVEALTLSGEVRVKGKPIVFRGEDDQGPQCGNIQSLSIPREDLAWGSSQVRVTLTNLKDENLRDELVKHNEGNYVLRKVRFGTDKGLEIGVTRCR